MNLKITQINNCIGCHACMNRCPVKAISMNEDKEGFLYPKVNENKCLQCGLCETICPALNMGETIKPLTIYAAKNNCDEERLKSSSGGIFPLLAKKIMENDGIVFGACFDEEWNVKHTYIQRVEDISMLCGSKYVQSTIGNSYAAVEEFLKMGKIVLFTGTPCQIMGLKSFLQKEYSNLFTVDLACHGVPSPKVWRKYLAEICPHNQIESINFRDKRNSWSAFHITITEKTKKDVLSECYTKNNFMRGFIQNLFLRPSCHQCPAKQFKSKSDMTLGDFWGIQNFYPNFNDEKGVSVVFINTEKGKSLFDNLAVTTVETNYEKTISANYIVEKSVKMHPKRKVFFQLFNQEQKSVNRIIEQLLYISYYMKIKNKMKQLLMKIL